jgi:uncharacterized OB-fold protein
MSAAETEEYGDPTTRHFWAGAREHRLLIQRCAKCGHHQFYPRPFCLECQSDEVEWVEASGFGTIYSMTTVRVQIAPEFRPPYRVAVVALDEGPRMVGGVIGAECGIGARVRATWRDREGLPPLIAFEPD